MDIIINGEMPISIEKLIQERISNLTSQLAETYRPAEHGHPQPIEIALAEYLKERGVEATNVEAQVGALRDVGGTQELRFTTVFEVHQGRMQKTVVRYHYEITQASILSYYTIEPVTSGIRDLREILDSFITEKFLTKTNNEADSSNVKSSGQ
jgi:hypothetical protein